MLAVVVKLAEKIASGAKNVLTTFVVIVKRQVLFMFVRVVDAGRVQTVMKVLSASNNRTCTSWFGCFQALGWAPPILGSSVEHLSSRK